MRRTAFHHGHTIGFFRASHETTKDEVLAFAGAASVRAFVREFARDAVHRGTLRQLLAEFDPTCRPRLLTDEELVRRFARLLESGRVGVWRRLPWRGLALREEGARDTLPAPAPVGLPETDLVWIAIRLLDVDGQPMAGERFQIQLPEQEWQDGVLNARGAARYDDIVAGLAKVRFPDIDEEEWYFESERPLPQAAPVTATDWVGLRLLEDDGTPVANARYLLRPPGAGWIEGRLDGDGHARVEGLEPGICQIRFPEYDIYDWEAWTQRGEPWRTSFEAYEDATAASRATRPAPMPAPEPTAWVGLRLLEDDGTPIAHARYQLKPPGGEWRDGTLDGDGHARVDGLDPGVCEVRFPDYDIYDWQAWAQRSEPWPSSIEAYESATVASGGSRTAPVAAPAVPPTTAWVALRLLEEDGTPIAHARYQLKPPGGEWTDGALDGDGRARVDGLASGVCQVRFPDYDIYDWQAWAQRSTSWESSSDAYTEASATERAAQAPGVTSPAPASTAWVALRLLEDDGTPVAHARYELKPPGGEWRDGTLDGDGHARVDGLDPGVCEVRFPDYDIYDWQAWAQRSEPWPSSIEAYESATVASGGSRTAPVAAPAVPPTTAWVALRLLEEDGTPIAHARYELRPPGGEWRDGVLDGDGHARVDGLAPGVCQVRFPDYDLDDWDAWTQDSTPWLSSSVAESDAASSDARTAPTRTAPTPAAPAEAPLVTAWVALRLVDEDGAPVARARYRLKPPGGEWIEGTLDGDGRARIEGLAPGTCRVEFPDYDEDDWLASAPGSAPATAPVDDPAAASGTPPATPPPTAWVALRLVNEDGTAVANARYRIKPPGGEWRDGTLDGDGHARVEGLAPGACRIEFPEYDEDDWIAA